MDEANPLDHSSTELARRGLLFTSLFVLAGALVRSACIPMGALAGLQMALVTSSLLVTSGILGTLLFLSRVSLQTVAGLSTLYFAFDLASASTLAICGDGGHPTFLVYLMFFFPLLAFNKLVNRPEVAVLLDGILLAVPLSVIGFLLPRLVVVLDQPERILLLAYCLSYAGYAALLNLFASGRTASKPSPELAAGSVREKAELLDLARDAIFVQDMETRIRYWNKSAEHLYGRSAKEVMGRRIAEVFPDISKEMNEIFAVILQDGGWSGVISQLRRDATTILIESRCTLVSDDGHPRSILSINTDITNRKAAEARIEHLAFFDVLTELPNRLLLRERLDRALAAAIHRGNIGALLCIDLDDLKILNDTLGHHFGDRLLQQVAIRLSSCVRQSDTVARLGGDEFVVMTEGLSTDPEVALGQATAIGHKILGAFAQPFRVGNYEWATTISIGITLFPTWSDSVDELLKRADLAMYQARAQGRNRMCFFDPAMQRMVDSRAELQSDLRRAVQRSEFELHYQPQVNNLGRVTGSEALLRWTHPRRGIVAPGEFIPLLEEAGLIVELGRWVLHTACAQLAAWAKRPESERLTVAVNVSIRQFLDADFVDLVLQVIRETGANPNRLKLEITETAMLDHAEETIAKMTVLKQTGVGFSLDDFGTGYSSLSRLKRLPLDQLKIDGSFIKDVLTDHKDASIVRTIILLGKNLNLSVIAEGVETEGQLDFLEAEGCSTYQGFLFSAALPAASFEIFLAAGCLVRGSR